MPTIEGGNNPVNLAHVDDAGRVQTRSVSVTEQQDSSVLGNTFNLNTGQLELTDDVETPIFYIKNDSETQPIKVSRVFITMLDSTGGVGAVEAKIYYNVRGDILDAPDLPIFNFNAGSANELGVTTKIGATGVGFSNGASSFGFLFPSDNLRQLTPFDLLVLPRGSNMLYTVRAPAGNTSVIVSGGANIFLGED